MIDERQLSVLDVPGAVPDDWGARHTITMTAEEMRRVSDRLKGKRRMPTRTVVKLAINVQDATDWPSPDDMAEAAKLLYQQAIQTVEAAGGKTQRVREWKVETE